MKAQTVVDARKQSFGKDDLVKLVADVDEIYAMKGSKVSHVDLRKEKLSKDDLATLMLGPTGNLRAPTIRQGRKLIIGFNEETYKRVFG